MGVDQLGVPMAADSGTTKLISLSLLLCGLVALFLLSIHNVTRNYPCRGYPGDVYCSPGNPGIRRKFPRVVYPGNVGSPGNSESPGNTWSPGNAGI